MSYISKRNSLPVKVFVLNPSIWEEMSTAMKFGINDVDFLKNKLSILTLKEC